MGSISCSRAQELLQRRQVNDRCTPGRTMARSASRAQFLVCAGERPDESTRDSVALPESHTRDATSDSQESRDPTANGRLGSDSCREIARKRNLTVWPQKITKSRKNGKKRKNTFVQYPKKRSPLSRLSPGARAARTRARSGRRPRHRLGGSGAPSPLGPLGLAAPPRGAGSGLWHRHCRGGGSVTPCTPTPRALSSRVLSWVGIVSAPGLLLKKR